MLKEELRVLKWSVLLPSCFLFLFFLLMKMNAGGQHKTEKKEAKRKGEKLGPILKIPDHKGTREGGNEGRRACWGRRLLLPLFFFSRGSEKQENEGTKGGDGILGSLLCAMFYGYRG